MHQRVWPWRWAEPAVARNAAVPTAVEIGAAQLTRGIPSSRVPARLTTEVAVLSGGADTVWVSRLPPSQSVDGVGAPASGSSAAIARTATS